MKKKKGKGKEGISGEKIRSVGKYLIKGQLQPADGGQAPSALKPVGAKRVILLGRNRRTAPRIIISYEDEGVYVKLPDSDGDEKLTEDRLLRILDAQDIDNFQGSHVLAAMKEDRGKDIWCAPAQRIKWKDEQVKLEFNDEETEAHMSLSRPSGMGRRLSKDEIIGLLCDEYGLKRELIIEASVDKLLANGRYGVSVLAARGTEPVDPQNGRLEWFVNITDDREADKRWKEIDGRIDYKDIKLFESVEEGQLIVKVVPPVKGKNGINVLGKDIIVPEPLTAKLPQGENVTFSDDRTEMRAACGGRVELKNGWVVIKNRFVVDGDVNLSVGNINFPGDVVITGNVLSGFEVKAGGNIEIHGTVESAYIRAKRKIMLYRGVQGGGNATIIAGEGLRARFVENATIVSHENIIAESIIQCDVECDGYIEVIKGRGVVVGGHITSGRYIVCQNLGSISGIPTLSEIGATANMRDKVDQLQNAITKCEDRIKYLSTFNDWVNDELELKFKSEIEIIERSRDLLEKQLVQLNEQLENMKHSKVHVLKKAYPNSSVVIDGVGEKLYDTVQHVSFVREESELKLLSCVYGHIKDR